MNFLILFFFLRWVCLHKPSTQILHWKLYPAWWEMLAAFFNSASAIPRDTVPSQRTQRRIFNPLDKQRRSAPPRSSRVRFILHPWAKSPRWPQIIWDMRRRVQMRLPWSMLPKHMASICCLAPLTAFQWDYHLGRCWILRCWTPWPLTPTGRECLCWCDTQSPKSMFCTLKAQILQSWNYLVHPMQVFWDKSTLSTYSMHLY